MQHFQGRANPLLVFCGDIAIVETRRQAGAFGCSPNAYGKCNSTAQAHGLICPVMHCNANIHLLAHMLGIGSHCSGYQLLWPRLNRTVRLPCPSTTAHSPDTPCPRKHRQYTHSLGEGRGLPPG